MNDVVSKRRPNPHFLWPNALQTQYIIGGLGMYIYIKQVVYLAKNILK